MTCKGFKMIFWLMCSIIFNIIFVLNAEHLHDADSISFFSMFCSLTCKSAFRTLLSKFSYLFCRPFYVLVEWKRHFIFPVLFILCAMQHHLSEYSTKRYHSHLLLIRNLFQLFCFIDTLLFVRSTIFRRLFCRRRVCWKIHLTFARELSSYFNSLNPLIHSCYTPTNLLNPPRTLIRISFEIIALQFADTESRPRVALFSKNNPNKLGTD